MAIYHASVKIISRSAGRSAVASIAYRAGECITNERDGITHDYTKRGGVVHTEILAPETAPDWVSDRARLWNEVEAIEKRKDSQLAREIEVALPRELSREQQIALVREFVGETCVAHGMVADFAIHVPKAADDLEQPHAHILLTTRRLDHDGFGKKATEWNPEFGKKDGRAFVADTSPLRDLREAWGRHANQALERAGQEARIDHRSLKAQRAEAVEIANDMGRPEPERLLAEVCAIELDREPLGKLGVAAAAMERRGEVSDRGTDRREMLARNLERQVEQRSLRQQLADIRDTLAELGKAISDKAREAWSKLDLSAAKGAITKARWSSLRLDPRALDAPKPVPETPALRLARSMADLERATTEIRSDQARGLVSLSSTLDGQRQAADQVAKELRELVKADPAKAWELSKRLEARAELPQSVRELKLEFSKDLYQEISRNRALERRLGQEMIQEINKTVQRTLSRGMSR